MHIASYLQGSKILFFKGTKQYTSGGLNQGSPTPSTDFEIFRFSVDFTMDFTMRFQFNHCTHKAIAMINELGWSAFLPTVNNICAYHT